jgi:hypothetical protein
VVAGIATLTVQRRLYAARVRKRKPAS